MDIEDLKCCGNCALSTYFQSQNRCLYPSKLMHVINNYGKCDLWEWDEFTDKDRKEVNIIIDERNKKAG